MNWHQRVPAGRRRNLLFRKFLVRRCAASAAERSAVRAACAADVLFYVNSFVWTYDPRLEPHKAVPFVAYPYQADGLRAIVAAVRDGRDLVVEKSRDMGASWLSLIAMDWLAQFHRGYSFLLLSRKENMVDNKGDLDALLPKIDFMHERLPGWLRPKVDRKTLRIGYPRTGSSIDGEATVGGAGVGGRRSAVFLDEFSRMENAPVILAGTADTTRCRIFNFTPWGTNNAAYTLAERARRGELRRLEFHWRDHPEKRKGLYRFDPDTQKLDVLDGAYDFPPDYPFVYDGRLRSVAYDAEDRRRGNPREMAMMWDIDYQGSAYQFFSPDRINDLKRRYARPPCWEGDVEAGPGGEFDGLVEAPNGPLKLWVPPNPAGRLPAGKYFAGADLSTGGGATASCLTLLDARGERVGEYVTPFQTPERYARSAVAICRWVADGDGEGARFAWELEGPGVVFGKTVIALGYRNVYFRRNELSLSKKRTDTPGWSPTGGNKLTAFEEYRTALYDGRFLNRSALALAETLHFVRTERGLKFGGGAMAFDPETGKADPSGAGENHGDRVVADALAWKCLSDAGLARPGPLDAPPDGVPPTSLAGRRRIAEDRSLQPEEY